jgi:PAS domain S-box-containing protein
MLKCVCCDGGIKKVSRTACGYFVFEEWVKKCTRAVITLCVLLVPLVYTSGQSYLVHQYSESETEGLPSTVVHGVIQDQWGRIWFATRAGIAVYDGVSWERYTVSDGLPTQSISKIRVDPKGRVWALSYANPCRIQVAFHDYNRENPGQANRFPHTWKTINEPEIPGCVSMVVTSFQLIEQPDKDKHIPIIAVGTRERGLYLWNRGSRGKWENITETHGLLSNVINGIVFLEGTGTLYLATDKGLSTIHISTHNLSIDNRLNQLLDLPSSVLKGIGIEYKDKYPDFPLTHSRVWLFTHDWLGYFQEGSSAMAALYPVGVPFRVKDINFNLLPDYRSGLYVGSRYELNYFNYKTYSWERLDTGNGLISEGADSLIIDFEKNIWIASERGASKISSRRFSNFQRFHGLLEDEVSAVLEVEPGKFILGHNRGITLYNGKKFKRIPFPEARISQFEQSRVLDMHPDSKKNTWMAAALAGVAKVTPRGEITWYGKENGLPEYIACVWVDNRDNVWVGTKGGIFIRTGNENKFVPIKNKTFSNLHPRRIYGSGSKLRYIATHEAGMYVYEHQTKQWKHYGVPGDWKANYVYTIKKDSRGRLLIGTLNGLFILENQTFRKFKENNFQVNRPVYFILEDNQHRLWFGTDNGVVRWDGNTEKKYSTHDGLIGHETNRAAALQDSRGRIWIGTNRGVSIYDQAFETRESFKPRPRIQLLNLEAGEKSIPLDRLANESIRLSHDENTLVFHFRGISFSDETAVRFQNKLEGFEEKWSEEHYPYKQMIRYTSLPPGSYRFHLKARNTLGVWSPEVTSPEIIIRLPFNRTWWFFLGISFLVGFVFYVIFRFFSARRQAVLLEKEVEKRTDQLQAVEKQYRNLFEESKDVVFISAPDGKLIDVNPAGMELFGYHSREEALNIPIIKFYTNPSERAVFRKEIETKGFVKDYQLELKRKDGEPITVQLTAAVVRDKAGKITAYRGIIRDITQQKRLEQQLIQAQKMEAIGTLAGGIAHDFNNILAMILGYTELVMEDLPKGTHTYQNAKQVLSAADRAADLVKQILAFSRQSKQERKPLRLSLIVKEALKLLRSTLPSTIEICQEIRVNPGADIVLANATQVHQILMNLAANAAHAMQEKGGRLVVSLDNVMIESDAASNPEAETSDLDKHLKTGPYLSLTVSDTGHGMSADVMKRIFDPFFTTKEPGEGTGMGLAVVHGIVKSHGGDISVSSKPGKGTTLQVYLPQIQLEIESSTQSESRPAEELPGGSERILLVDDEAALTQMGKQILENLGYKVVTKSSSVEALEFFRSAPDRFDLVISDVTMPHMTGIQLAKEIKHINPDIPIILCSGHSATITGEQIKAFGISDFIMKPIIKSELARIVRKVLDERKK